MEGLFNMRDRRNLSTSSTSPTDSAISAAFYPTPNEKQVSSSPLSPQLEPFTKENVSRPHGHSQLRLGIRLLAALGIVLILWCIVSFEAFGPLNINRAADGSKAFSSDPDGEHMFRTEPSPIKVFDSHGRSRWTVQIPHNYSFPLQTKHIEEVCQKGGLLRDEMKSHSRMMAVKDWRNNGGYYTADTTFIEIEKAENEGTIPQAGDGVSNKVCGRSLTFAFDVEDDSFGKSLLMLWLSYGLAKKEHRAFFIDDTRWLYGRYASFFMPLPSPGCDSPPSHHIVPCPHNARHLLVSSATVPCTFGSAFEREFTKTWWSGVSRSQRIYDLLRKGYEELFHLTGEHTLYATARVAKIREDARQRQSSVVGMHLRRGDLHPFEHQYSQDYLPLERLGAAARGLLQDQSGQRDQSSTASNNPPPLLLATDDPEMFESAELQQSASPFIIRRAQERIQLATKATLDLSAPAESVPEPDSIYTKHVAENTGWEGGFYSALFYSLGRPSTFEKPGHSRSSNIDDAGRYEELFSEEAVHMRELIGRAYLLDLAVLGASDSVVCASSSATCRLLGVMLGWDAVKDGRWMNVDDGRVWSWDGRR